MEVNRNFSRCFVHYKTIAEWTFSLKVFEILWKSQKIVSINPHWKYLLDVFRMMGGVQI